MNNISPSLSDRCAVLWNLPRAAFSKIMKILPSLQPKAQEALVANLEMFQDTFEKQYAVDQEYLSDQEKILASVERSAKRLEEKETDSSAMQSILSQIES